MWHRWARFVQRRPAPVAIAGLAVLVLAAVPALGLRLGSADASNDPTSSTTHQAYDLIAKGFGPGANGPILVVADTADTGAARGCPASARRAARRAGRGVGERRAAEPSGHGRARDAGRRGRSRRTRRRTGSCTTCATTSCPTRSPAPDLQVHIGGDAASAIDFTDVIGRRLPIFIGGGARPELPAAARRVPFGARAAQGGADEPAVDRRRVRRRRRDLPVGLGRERARREQGADRGVGADDAVRDRLRAVDGLRGVPA